MSESKRCDEWPVLTTAELAEKLPSLPLWEIASGDVPKLSKKFSTKNFAVAMSFLNSAAEIAESQNHHPGGFSIS